MYVPEAKQLMSGGFFNRHPEQEVWDTPEVAKLILHYLIEGNPERVEQDSSPESGESLRELAQKAIDSTDPHETIDIFLEVKRAVAAAPNALVRISFAIVSRSLTDCSLHSSSMTSLTVHIHSLCFVILSEVPLSQGQVQPMYLNSGSQNLHQMPCRSP